MWGGSRGWGRRGEVEGRGCALTNQRGRCAPRSPNSAARSSPHATALVPFLQPQAGSFTQGVDLQVRTATSLSVVPQGAMSPCTAHEEPPSPVASRDTPPQKHGLQTTGTPRTPQMRLCEGTRNTPSYRRKKTPREHQKSIRRMRSVQDSVLPEGVGAKPAPTSPLIHRCAAS